MGLPIVQNSAAPVAPPVHVPGDVEKALAALWPVARARLWRRPHLRASFALWRRFDLAFADLGKLKVRIPAGQVPDCESCTDLCCTGPNAIVSLRFLDIARLVDAGRAAHVVFERPARPPTATGWARKEADDSVFHTVFPVLQRDASGTCTLLTEDRLCGAFPSWPLSCARYPYALDKQLGVIFYAKGCTTYAEVAPTDAPLRVRALLRGVVDAYNERIKDVVLLALARPELAELGLLQHVRAELFPIRAT